MPKYIVHGIVKIDVQSEIEASSEAEAMLIASQMSGSDFEDAYCGEWGSEQEFADDLADQTITPDLPEMGQIYFDYQKFARDLFMGDYWSSDGYIFRNC